jgi:hypothetical protein
MLPFKTSQLHIILCTFVVVTAFSRFSGTCKDHFDGKPPLTHIHTQHQHLATLFHYQFQPNTAPPPIPHIQNSSTSLHHLGSVSEALIAKDGMQEIQVDYASSPPASDMSELTPDHDINAKKKRILCNLT